MYQDEWGNIYNTLEEAKMGVLKQFGTREIANELYYHVTIEEVLEWCIGNAEFHKQFAGEFEATINALCEDYVFEEVEEEHKKEILNPCDYCTTDSWFPANEHGENTACFSCKYYLLLKEREEKENESET